MPVYLIQHADKLRLPGDPGISELGRTHAERTGVWARHAEIRRIYCSPLLRSRQTAQTIADAIGTAPVIDQRATERMNWDGRVPFAVFNAEWAKTVEDRAYAPATGDSSSAAARRLYAMVCDVAATDDPVAIVTHGGVTVDLLRTLLGDDAIDRELLTNGVPSCAITALKDTTVTSVATVEHLQA
jgi:broad specificity phosphatase PhoE